MRLQFLRTLQKAILTGCIVAGSTLVVITPLDFAQAQELADDEGVVAPDLQAIYDKTKSARTVKDYSAIIDFCQRAAKDSTHPAKNVSMSATC